ncbi:CDP-alcohol phosphatidyltransferase family protein [Cellulomonas fimi]|uniref:CDP-alcohol phosphatidyltransferase n=1 Tax=Cellulomonas fimi (strain ATCC 484 / DSM 20113 / JCM 1341 / CCUG 24087 / LMG 16345 / NBRC 15513 / NCIMB 8980 / NCTC 7547 / NRS-133) TaxID=590998 RepID=F4GZ42_CELFA|nr:CDP-alcohol phosphatidyltransferase family protein [Cellulomonas fimi]AEE47158.1 CDP-alcohol phosphatidyltransferase [Cellulomonas fimi ATCC 484]NNH07705.1 CDP-alcohol phosphatidyltransferase family protein [Cellulomonas fimi]VEH35438.1 sn-1,2-diacylglycerol ethanolamine- and cholinephosphotranferases [Cellulomonas fimi]
MTTSLQQEDNVPSTVTETYAQTLARLGSVQKGARGAPAYSRFVNRRAGRVLAAWAYRAGLSPNQVTAISAVWTFSAIVVLALAPVAWWTGVLVTVLLLVGYAFDSADGQVARLRGGGSIAGEWLDHVIDAVKVSSLHLALLVGLYRADAVPDAWLLVPLGYSAVWSVLFFTMILNDQLRRQAGVTMRATAVGERPSVLRSLVVAPTDYGVLCLAFLLYGATTAFGVVYALLGLATAGYLALALRSWFAEMRTLRRPTGEARGGEA